MIEYLSDTDNWNIALSLGMLVMVGTLVGYAVWFHRTIRRTPGGSNLMARQKRNPPLVDRTGSLFGATNQMGVAGKMAGDINSGKYGAEVKRLMTKTYWFFGVWTVVTILWFGFLIYVDALNKPIS